MKRLIAILCFSMLFVNAFAAIDIDLPPNVNLMGDIRTKWKSEWGAQEFHNFKTEATIGLNYTKEKGWMCAKVKASTFNGKESLMFLNKAYVGYLLFDNENVNFTVELGRNVMEDMFDSKMQFNSYYNGFHFSYAYAIPDIINFELHGGPFVIDSNAHHYGWIAEAIWKNLANTNISCTYSFMDWNKPEDENFNYAISQLKAQYDVGTASVYAAYLYNHQEESISDWHRYHYLKEDSNIGYGYYFGFSIGKIKQARDCSFDVCYQYCSPYTVPFYDFEGLCRGIQMKAVVAITNTLALQTKFALHDAPNNKRLELHAIYTW